MPGAAPDECAATPDEAIHPDAQRAAAERLGATTVQLDASHTVAVSQSVAMSDLIAEAVTAAGA